MFQRLANSWQLIKASWAVLLADKELLIFPIISFFASLIVTATFAFPMFLAGMVDEMANNGIDIAGYVVGFLFYAVMYFVTIYFNSALVGAAMIRLEGGDPTVGDGFRIATKHIGNILFYALIAATVGMILKMVSEKSNSLGRIVVGVIGTVWNIATFLVVPVLVVEGLSPIEAIKRSTSLLKQTWGEQIVGNGGIGLVFGWLIFMVVMVGVGAIVFAGAVLESPIAIGVAVAGMVLGIVSLSLVSGALSGIYTAAVYRYATTGDTSQYFDPTLVKNAFKAK
jgi:hypothetical protein